MKLKRYWFMILIIALIAAAVLFVLFSPRPIVKDSDNISIWRIAYNPYVGQDIDSFVEITEYDTEKIAACLSRYKERRILFSRPGYSLTDVEIQIGMHTGNVSKNILLGNINYSYESAGKPKYQIMESDSLILELLQLIGVEP